MEAVCGRTKISEGEGDKGGAQRKSSNDRKQEKPHGTKKKNQSTSSNKRLEKIKQTKSMPLFSLELKFIFVPHGTILKDSFLCCLI